MNDIRYEIQVQRFWASGNNKEKLQSLSRDFFVELSMRNNIKHIIASNFISIKYFCLSVIS